MTKTFIKVGSNIFTKPSLPLTMIGDLAADGSSVWNFEFGALGFV